MFRLELQTGYTALSRALQNFTYTHSESSRIILTLLKLKNKFPGLHC